MKQFKIRLTASISTFYESTPNMWVKSSRIAAVAQSLYTRDNAGRVVKEEIIPTESEILQELLRSGVISTGDLAGRSISSISTVMGCIRSAILKNMDKNNYDATDHITIQQDGQAETKLPLDNMNNCINALKSLKAIIPTATYQYDVVYQQPTWSQTAYNMVRDNAAPFFAGVVGGLSVLAAAQYTASLRNV